MNADLQKTDGETWTLVRCGDSRCGLSWIVNAIPKSSITNNVSRFSTHHKRTSRQNHTISDAIDPLRRSNKDVCADGTAQTQRSPEVQSQDEHDVDPEYDGGSTGSRQDEVSDCPLGTGSLDWERQMTANDGAEG